jgi:hypothetical protein
LKEEKECQMKHKHWLLSALGLVFAIILWASLPAAKAAASGVIGYYPTYIPADTTDGNCATGTPYAIQVSYTGLDPLKTYTVKAYQYLSSATDHKGCMWNWQTNKWIAIDNTYPSSLPSISGVSVWSNWLFLKDVTAHAGASDLVLRVSLRNGGVNDDATISSGLTPMDMSGSGDGGWLDESGAASRAGRGIVVYNGMSIVGLYVAENNNVDDGYAYAPGGFKLSVPSCTDCGYTILTFDLTAPGTIIGTGNTLGQGGCPCDVPAGTTVSLDACNVPTNITLSSLSSQSGEVNKNAVWAALLVTLLAGASLMVVKRRRSF